MASRKTTATRTVLILEGQTTICYKHDADEILSKLENQLGETEAKSLRNIASTVTYSPHDYNILGE